MLPERPKAWVKDATSPVMNRGRLCLKQVKMRTKMQTSEKASLGGIRIKDGKNGNKCELRIKDRKNGNKCKISHGTFAPCFCVPELVKYFCFYSFSVRNTIYAHSCSIEVEMETPYRSERKSAIYLFLSNSS